ncbi:hypothetical protein [Mameliella sp.]|uniref:hypothetical protein n=1 Tax=Mameliella sp. TaxID=1924940 RepID=UPI003BAACD14
MAAPTFEASSEVESNSNTASLSLSVPSGATSGDLLLVLIAPGTTTGQPVTAPSVDWTEYDSAANDSSLCWNAFWCPYDDAGAGPYVFSFDASSRGTAQCILIRGADTTDPIDVQSKISFDDLRGPGDGQATTFEDTGLTTTVDDCLVVGGWVSFIGQRSVTVGSPMTLIDNTFNPNTATSRAAQATAYLTQATAGATGTWLWTLDANSTYADLCAVAIKPAAGGGNDGALTTGGIALSSTAERELTATGAFALGGAQLDGAGQRTMTATGALAAGSAQLDGSGVVSTLISGTGALSPGAAQLDGSGVVNSGISGTGALSPGGGQLDATGARSISGSGAMTVGGAQLDGSGARIIPGSAALAAGGAHLDGSGATGDSGVASLTAGGVQADATGTRTVPGVGDFVTGGTQIDSTGERIATASGALSIGPASAEATGERSVTGGGALAIGAAQIDGSGTRSVTGSASLTIAAAQLEGVGSKGVTGSASLTIAAAQLEGAGSKGVSGGGIFTVGGLTIGGAEVPDGQNVGRWADSLLSLRLKL